MKRAVQLLSFLVMHSIITTSVSGQEEENCFLNDFEPKAAVIPPFENYRRTTSIPTDTLRIDFSDTLNSVSNYIFGNAVAVWVNPDVNNPVLMGHLAKLSPTLIRFPGGSWSDIYFWNGNPGDLPSTIYNWHDPWDFTDASFSLVSWSPQFGPSRSPTFESYLDMRDQINSQGLITINYGYARYGQGANPPARAAHLAADWVRADSGHTKFWEIGNENAGPWEAGWRINTETNQDGQPEDINGELYGQHFNLFVDSMKKAASEIGAEIYIGAQIIQYDGTNSWNVADRDWNESVFSEVDTNADFYVIHNYFGGTESNPESYLDNALNSINDMYEFIYGDIEDKNATSRPIALTEWNISGGGAPKTSIINGMQGVLGMSEMVKLGYGMSCRWLIANWGEDGMFYHGSGGSIPEWNPRPDFFYIYYLQKYFGNYMLGSKILGSNDLIAYTSVFESGEIGIVLVNKGTTPQTVLISIDSTGYGNRYYYYSLTGGTDDPDYSQYVFVNGTGPEATRWGPLDSLEYIKANSDTLGHPVKIYSPKRSVQYIILETGSGIIEQVDADSFYVITEDDVASITVDNGTLLCLGNFIPENVTYNEVIWTLSDSSKAWIDAIGLLTAHDNGQVTAIGTTVGGGLVDSVVISISNQRFEVTGLTISTIPNTSYINKDGDSLQFIAHVQPEYADDTTVAWSVNNPDLATIDTTGLLIAKANGTVTVTCTTNDGGYMASKNIIIRNQTGIFDYTFSNLKIYPVPAKDRLIIENEYPVVQYEILNIEGKVLNTIYKPGLKTEIDITGLGRGIYFIRVQTNMNTFVAKFIK